MNKQEVIEKLRKHGAWCTECHDTNGEKDRYVKVAKVRELLEQIDEPQAEKVEVPDFVAKWFKANKISLESNIAAAFRRIGSDENYTKGPIYEWLNDSSNEPIQTLFKMKNGYTIKTKRWVVKLPETGKYFANISYGKMFGMIAEISEREAKDAYPFTDRAKAEAVAVLVEGSVEEV